MPISNALRLSHRSASSLTAIDHQNAPRLSISDAYDGGNIELVNTRKDEDRLTVSLKIKPDPYTELEQTNHLQYFSFRSTVSFPTQHSTAIVEYLIEKYVLRKSLGRIHSLLFHFP
jgi:hypothetical protein